MTPELVRRRGAVRLLAASLLALLQAAGTVPAHAEHVAPRMLVSRSESGPFHDQLGGTLLGDVGRLVPLDRATGTFYLKNATRSPAEVSLAVRLRGRSNVLTDGLAVTVRVGSTAETGVLPSGDADCALAVSGPQVPPGGVQRVDVVVAVGDLEGQQGTAQEFAIDAEATMRHLAGGDDAPASCRRPDRDRGRDRDRDGNQGGPDPVAAEEPASACRDTVVTLLGDPTCPPREVTAGIEPPGSATVASTGVVWVVLGGVLLLLTRRRRPTAPAAHD